MIVVQVILWILLLVSIFLLIGVILLQEGKGGGLAEAFGGVGAETFGVKAAGINKFTSIVGAVFLAVCIALTLFKPAPSSDPALKNPGAFPNFNRGAQGPPPNAPPVVAPPVVPPNTPPNGNKSPSAPPDAPHDNANPPSPAPDGDKPPTPPHDGNKPPN
jgi:preprotein translocase subunit SecG